MCGFSGQINLKGIVDKVDLENSALSIKHRGPDAFGTWYSDKEDVGLVHRRLSIIDLSDAANQPMSFLSNQLVIVFNGEIYNFREVKSTLLSAGINFNTSSDTEVILAAYSHWGKNCVKFLSGMFSFAIYDISTKNIFFARDRAGEKPFYYFANTSNFIFSSELRGLLAFKKIDRIIENDSLINFLSNGFSPPDKSLIKNVFKLPPAHAGNYSLSTGQLNTWKYWEPPACNNKKIFHLQDSLNHFQLLLDDSVKRQMMSDVPIGVLLSGGLDSSLITALASRHTNNLSTYTVIFPEYKKFDESKDAKLIADSFSTNHHVLEANNLDFSRVIDIVKKLDEPIFDSSVIPTYLVSSLINKHCKVALGGDGGDELFGGYSYYQDLLLLQHKFSFLPDSFLETIANFSKLLPLGLSGKSMLQQLDPLFLARFKVPTKFFDLSNINSLLKGFNRNDFKTEDIHELITNCEHFIDRVTRIDFHRYLPEDVLAKVDRASMLNSVETRAPFLDTQLIEFAFNNIPNYEKVNSYDKKIFLKKAAKSILPINFDYSRKQGFSIPLKEWLTKAEWMNGISDLLLSTSNEGMNQKYLTRMIDNQRNGFSNSERIFGLFVFEVWRQENNIKYA
jgi:asparagine synthase (glutamine-hydrolysing)